ncbi:ABC transporter permease [Youngiibacter fragilis]|uniref:Ribose ABC transporter permease n=1 Tax=Youngiibacter fragilis 232.1 TaxID=994573 RepID=V7I6A9_9CLOT|nr:ABC transporter permease [Youngiibacter fragilis]ETA81418.1 ribose ABC transporter permease [Youngiibacter fragilis 232.1]
MENLTYLFSSDMFLATLRLSIPLTLAAVGATICQRSGVINLGVEGMMLLGAFSGVLGVHLTGSPYLGIMLSLAVGALIGWIYAVLVLHYDANQSVSGIGLNVFASGLTIVLTRAVWKSDGLSGSVKQVPSITVPVLSEIPFLGLLFKNQSPYLYFTVMIVILAWWFMYRTKQGLRLRAIGEHDEAAATVGIPVKLYRYKAIIVCGMLCALGGSYLSIVQNNRFVKDMVAGRGFMALAANIFGGANPLGSWGSSLVFAFAQAVRINLEVDIPDQFLQMLPYALTLFVLLIIGLKNRKKYKDKIA